MTECMSFSDLYIAAKGRDFTDQERAEFAALDQDARNLAVADLARQARCIRTEMRPGTDGVNYLAFWRDDSLYHVPESDGQSTYFATRQQRGARERGEAIGDFTSFGSKEPDGWHKTTFVEDADGATTAVSKRGGGAMGGGLWRWVAGRITGR